MANDISRKYTDEIYLSKSQLQDVLNTSLVDGYWKEIRSYRGAYAHRLNLKTLRKDYQMGIILTPAIEAKITLGQNDIETLISSIKKMDSQEKDEAERILFYENLSSLNKIKNLNISDAALKQVVSGRYRSSSDNDQILNFYNTLKHFASSDNLLPPNEDFLGEAYSQLLGYELTSFYRKSDFDSKARLAEQQDRDYPYAPFEKIGPAMHDLLSVIHNEEFKPIVRSLLALYYLDAVSPFASHNKELALLLALDVLANEYGKEAFYLPLLLLLEENDSLKEALSGVRTGDFTYFVLYAIGALKDKLAYLNGEIQRILLTIFQKEANYVTKEEVEAFDGKPEQMSFFDNVEEEVSEPIHEEKPAFEEIKKAEPIKPIIKDTPPKRELIRPERVKKVAEVTGGEMSIKMESRPLSDKEVKEYTQYLLESNPSLNKKQASFLATHCTLGHYYTIQQYKKFARCAYETARTSMDKLAEESYYEKKLFKNKYVYTPIAGNGKR